MIQINETFRARSVFPCEDVARFGLEFRHDPVWRQTVAGCMVLYVLKDIYNFNITYSVQNYANMSKSEQHEAIYPHFNDSVDIYVKTMELQADLLDNAFPLHGIFMWRFGFILRRRYNSLFKPYYTHPFTTPVWICLCISILLGSITFYLLSSWDRRRFGLESSYHYELLLAFSAYCQHILPLQAVSGSRRVAYLTFIICAYVVHSFYTSNLLSHLVSHRDKTIDLEGLVESDYEIGLLKDTNIATDKKHYESKMDKNLSIVWNKVQSLKLLDTQTALNALMESKLALLCDYYTVYPILRKKFENADICQLVEIDLYSNVKYYFFTSKNFKYKEEFKIGILRSKETGLLEHYTSPNKFFLYNCQQYVNHYEVQLEHAIFPITILFTGYVIASIILIGEKLHYKRNQVWPYVN